MDCVDQSLKPDFTTKFVLYFDQLSGAAHTQKLVEILLWLFSNFLWFQMFIGDFSSKNKRNGVLSYSLLKTGQHPNTGRRIIIITRINLVTLERVTTHFLLANFLNYSANWSIVILKQIHQICSPNLSKPNYFAQYLKLVLTILFAICDQIEALKIALMER